MNEDPSREQILLAAERNHLALERTFLSWIRTGLAGLGGSVAMMRLLTFETDSSRNIAHIIGYILLFWGAGVFYLALKDYEHASKTFRNAYPGIRIPTGRRRVVVLVLFVLVLLLLILFLS